MADRQTISRAGGYREMHFRSNDRMEQKENLNRSRLAMSLPAA